MRDVPCPKCGCPVQAAERTGDWIDTIVLEDGTVKQERSKYQPGKVWHRDSPHTCTVHEVDELFVLMRRATIVVVA